MDVDEPGGADDDDDAMAGDGLGCLTQATRWSGRQHAGRRIDDITICDVLCISQYSLIFNVNRKQLKFDIWAM